VLLIPYVVAESASESSPTHFGTESAVDIGSGG
jgi:hypothetical protein